jgi:hypothetical protein
LTPEKLAAFYRETGGNYDTLFLKTKGLGLSFIYQSLGCFHTLQPTADPFKPPSIPALLPHGFVRWQTIQLLLCPEEHSRFLQNAVSRWDIRRPDGGIFPKTLPREAFPTEPDPGMVRWHEQVTQRLEQEYLSRNTSSHSTADFRPPHRSRSRGSRASPRGQADRRRAAFSARSESAPPNDFQAFRGRPGRENPPPMSSRFSHDHGDYVTVERRPKGSRTTSPRPPTPSRTPASSRKPGRRQKARNKAADSTTRPSGFTHHPAPTAAFESSASDASAEDSTWPKRMDTSEDRRSYKLYSNLGHGEIPRHRSHDTLSARRSEYFNDRNSYPPSSKFRHEFPLPASVRYEEPRPSKTSKHPRTRLREYIFDDSEPLDGPSVEASRRGNVRSYSLSGKSRSKHRSTRPSVSATSGDASPSDHAQPKSHPGSSGGHQTESGDSSSEPWQFAGIPSHGDRSHKWDDHPSYRAPSRGRRTRVYEAELR